ncbi:AMP-binding protein (plasmid) [Paraburkholderia sprentiae WSM5005]|uniref:AMP-binding protein n=1 Tax=Paraburkholderia sprentiae WSM5005 TaxID=754502 RepID=A0A1I9YWL6_9BURK|nr:AMP-binding protein [Paraburkholderia sprentiae]APA90567.1 AMP-binding protein [Paraburkholderia sprentiae WSM5005]
MRNEKSISRRIWTRYYSDPEAQFALRKDNGLAIFREAVRRNSGGAAIHYFDATISYGELDELSGKFAAWLHSRGVGVGDRVALYLQNVPQFLICLLGAWKVGAVGVSINPMNRSRELSLLLADSGSKVLVLHPELFEETACEVLRSFPDVTTVTTSARDFQARNDERIFTEGGIDCCEGTLNLKSVLACSGHALHSVGVSPESSAMLVYTSGTTGVPKAAVVSHLNFAYGAEIWHRWISLPDGAPVLGMAPLFHITGLMAHLGLCWAAASPVILCMRFHPQVAADAATEWSARFVVGAITAFIAMLNHPDITREHLASLTNVYTGGAPVPATVVDDFERKFGQRIRNCYGLTESTSLAIGIPPTATAPIGALGSISIGVPVWDTDVCIVGDDGDPVPHEEVGEIRIRGPQIVSGYWQREQETGETFRGGWLCTGDVGYMDSNGWVFVVDRKKDVIIASGYKVWPKEVEDVIYGHPAIREVAVVGAQDPYRGETVKAVVSLKPGFSLEPEELIAYCKERMAAYKYPRIVEVISDLPKTVTGKILRRELR